MASELMHGHDAACEEDERFMREALAEARLAAEEGEVPIGAVVVHDGRIIARAHNRRELDEDPSAHAEFSAMCAAARALGRWRLTGCTVYVTLEPCCMCAGLMVNARIDRCVYGAADPKGGALGSLYQLNADARLNHAFPVTAGVLADECASVLRTFFAALRGGTADERPAEERPAGERVARERVAAGCSCAVAITPGPRTLHRAGRPLSVLLAIDSFKGSASSAEVEAWVAEGIRRAAPDATVTCLPIGDGGEGTVAALAAATDAVGRDVAVHDPFGRETLASYVLQGPIGAAAREDGGASQEPRAAFIEMAAAAGLDRSPRTPEAARAASTAGVGELVRDALAQGARVIYLGLGGSATTDGGAGFLQALGARMLDDDGQPLEPGLSGLARVASIDLAPARAALGDAQLIALTDVRNPLVGARGAVKVFGPQKGLPREDSLLDEYDRWMIRYGALLDDASRALASRPFRSLAGVPGSGAAGGLGAAVLALGGTLAPGIEAVLDLVGFDDAARASDVVVTGEGMMDGQTAEGKAPIGVARRVHALGRPVIAVVGGRARDLDAVYQQGIDLVLPIVRRPMTLDEAMSREETHANLVCAGETAARACLLSEATGRI